jgi:serine/threonine protein kinase
MLGPNELTRSFIGTPEYLAPEIVSHKSYDKGVDWWALGILIYEMLFGKTPFFDPSRNVMYKKIQSAKVVFPDI